MSIARTFGEQDRRPEPGLLGIRGTGWFLSPRLIVTAAHVAEAMDLSTQDWKVIAIKERQRQVSIPARMARLIGTQAEKIAVLELQKPFAGASALRVRTDPLVPEERLVSLAYPGAELRFASGRFVRYGDGEELAGMALLEMHDGDDRLVLDHGASGAPVLDCNGRVVAVVSTLITQIVNLPPRALRVSTAWQTPNVVSVPSAALKDFIQRK